MLIAAYAGSITDDIPTGNSTAHNILWVRGNENRKSEHKISEDGLKMTSSPSYNYTTEHVMKLNFSYTGNAKKYDVEIRLPAHIFTDREGNKIGSLEIPLPKYNPDNLDESEPPNASAKFNWRIDEATDEIVISNYTNIEGDFFLTSDIKYYGIYPHLVKNGYTNTFKAYMNVKDIAIGQIDTVYSNEITIEYKTKADLYSLTKYNSGSVSYKDWQESWGDIPEGINTKDYFYVRWYVKADASNNDTQPFTLRFKENDSGQDEYGTLFGVSSSKSGGFKRITLNEYNNTDESGAFNNPYATVSEPYTYSSQNNTYWTQYLYYMYPRTLLKDQKATVKNSIEATLTGIDGGTSSTETSTATYTYSEAPKPSPSPKPSPTIHPDYAYIYKYNQGKTYGGINEIENGPVTKKNVELNDYNNGKEGNFYFYGYLYGWYLSKDENSKEFGVNNWTAELYDDYVQLYNGNGYTKLDENDYQFTKLHFSGFSVSDPVSKDGMNVSMKARENDKYKPLKLLVKINGNWKDYAVIQKQSDGKYAFTPAAGYETVSVDSGSTLNIPLPENTTGVKYSYMDNGVYVYFSSYSYLTTELKPSEKVLSLIKGKNSVTVRNEVYVRSLDSNGKVKKSNYDYISHTLSRIVPISQCSKSYGSITNEIINSRYYVPVTIDAYVQFDYADAAQEDLINSGYIVEQRNSTFYDLLPPGTYADLSTIKVTGYKGAASDTNFSTNVEVIDNWKNSGRTLLVVHAQAPENAKNLYYYRYTNHYSELWSGMKLRFNLYNPWINIADNGDTLYNFAAYESHDGTLPNGYPDNAASGTIPSNLKTAFTDLNRDGNEGDVPESFLYCKTSRTFNILKAAEVGFKKAVSSPEEPEFDSHTKALLGGEYTYRLRLENAFSSTKDLVFYDILENAYGDNDHWKGSLIGVDVSHALSKNIDVKTYYTTQDLNDKNLFDDALYLDNHPEVWQSWDTNPPEDTSNVRAVAFDLRKLKNGEDFIARPGSGIYVSMIMRAPVNAQEHIKNKDLAYNRAFMANRKNSTSETGWDEIVSIEACNRVTVELKDMGLGFDKTSSPASGTAENPTIVYGGDNIEYKINLSNANTAQSFKDILLEDEIPEGLSFSADNIKVMIDDNPGTAQLLSKSTRAKLVSMEGRKLKFRVISLAGNEKLTIIIPAVVEPMSLDKNTLFENTAKITGIFGTDYILESNTTHHEQKYADFTPQISKTLKNRNMKANEFSFVLKDAAGKEIETKGNAAAIEGAKDTILFSGLHFDKPGEYTYTITENAGTLDSVVYDESVYTIKIKVTKQEDGSLKADADYIKDSIKEESIDFVNEYKVRQFTAKKMWIVPEKAPKDPLERHPSIELQLLRDGEPYGDPVIINPSQPDSFSTQDNAYTWENLPMYRADGKADEQSGNRIESIYTVTEVNIPDNYFMGMDDESQIVRNVYWPNARTVTKIWDGGTPEPGTKVTMVINQEVLDPDKNDEKITDIEYGAITLDGIAEEYPDQLPEDMSELQGEFSPWVYTIVLPVSGTYEGNNVRYFYTIKEQTIESDDYKLGGIEIIPAGGANVTNMRQTTEFTVNKSWINGPETNPTITITLLQDGEEYKKIELKDGETSYTFMDLPRFKEWEPATEENGFKASYTEYKYTVKENELENYNSKITETSNGADIVNEYVPPVKEIRAKKIWSGGPDADHTAVELMLMRSLEGGVPEKVDLPYAVSHENNGGQSYTYTWGELPLTNESGEQYTYYVVEPNTVNDIFIVNENRYAVTVDDLGTTITNTYMPPMGNVYAYKFWIDGNSIDYVPVDITLHRNIEGGVSEEVSAPYTLNSEESGIWQYVYTWENLPLKDENGNPYTYTFSEADAVNGIIIRNGRSYESIIYDNVIVNYYEPGVTKLLAKKIWSGGPEKDHTEVSLIVTRHTPNDPENVEEVIGEDAAVVKNADGSFSYTWDNLPDANYNGEPYIYDVKEASNLNGFILQNGNTYKVSKKALADGAIQITNTYVPPKQSQLELNILKRISGDTYAINAGDYSFKLSGDAPETIEQCDKDGRAEFVLSFNKTGRFSFTVSEIKDKVEGMQFDNGIYTINVNVSFNEKENRFEAETEVLKDGKEYSGSELVFTNNYTKPTEKPAPTPKPDYPKINVPIDASKVLRNGTIKADQFTFVLKDSRGKELARVSNDANGNISFPDRTFSRVVTNYTYTVEELAGKDKSVKYDDTIYTVKISTTPVNGQLKARVDLEKDGVPYDGEIVFVNTGSIPSTGDSAPATIAVVVSIGAVALAVYIALKRRESFSNK